MIVLDVNVLVAAHLAEHPDHETAHVFLSSVLTDDAVLVPDAVWSGFLRVVTNRRIFAIPATLAAATEFVRAVVAAPGYIHVTGLVDGIDPFLDLCTVSEATANLVPDAYIAAVAMAHGCAVATFDRDFRRFDGLSIVTP
ncbi:MAG: PIN domain-containing protein [Microbacteriaceae bacterium]